MTYTMPFADAIIGAKTTDFTTKLYAVAPNKRVTCYFFFFSSRRRHTRLQGDWSSDVCSSDLSALGQFHDLDAMILAVGHRAYLEMPRSKLVGMLRSGGVLVDVKSALKPEDAEIGRASCRERV